MLDTIDFSDEKIRQRLKKQLTQGIEDFFCFNCVAVRLAVIEIDKKLKLDKNKKIAKRDKWYSDSYLGKNG